MLKNKSVSFAVDVVYTWVNGEDKEWKKRKAKALGSKESTVLPVASHKNRFVDNNELRYSLRSLEKFCPWVNHIYIVTDRQVPQWLDLDNPRITIVDHTEIFRKEGKLPTFNSNAIELQVHRIPNLSEHFIYFNDDMFVGRSLTKDFFFDYQGNAKLWVVKNYSSDKLKHHLTVDSLAEQNAYQNSILNSRILINEKFDFIAPNKPVHSCKPLQKSVLYKIEKLFLLEYNKVLSYQFRTLDDLNMAPLFLFYQQAKGVKTTIIKKRHRYKFYYLFLRYLHVTNEDYVYIPLDESIEKVGKGLFLINKLRPALFCINDEEQSLNENKEGAQRFYDKFYSEPSLFERKIN